MIRRIVLTNFQKHAKLVIDLDPKVTCFVGPSDAGKSAVVRALYWCCLNRPGGTDFVRHGAKEASVKVYTRTRKIERVRSGRTNEYRIDGRVLKAFGLSNVPVEVAAALNVSEDNFRLQLEPHFWFGDTAGQVSQKLNEVVNLSLIDHALDYAATTVRAAKAEAEFAAERSKEASEAFDKLDWVPGYLRRSDALAVLEKEYRAKSHRIAGARDLVARATFLRRRRDRASEAMLGAKNLAAIGARAIETAKTVESVKRLLEQGRRAARLAKLDLTPFDRLHKLRTDGDAYSEKVSDLESLLNEGTKLEEEICRLNDLIKATESELKTSNRNCPACGQLIPRPTPSSPSPHPTCTSGRTLPSAVPRKARNGTRS